MVDIKDVKTLSVDESVSVLLSLLGIKPHEKEKSKANRILTRLRDDEIGVIAAGFAINTRLKSNVLETFLGEFLLLRMSEGGKREKAIIECLKGLGGIQEQQQGKLGKLRSLILRKKD